MEYRTELSGPIHSKFEELCELQDDNYIPFMREHIANAVGRLRMMKDEFLGPNLKLADSIAEKCNLLLDHYAWMPQDRKRLIVGAIRYFIVHMDSLPDTTPVVGLDDDALVLNFVLERVELSEHCIQL